MNKDILYREIDRLNAENAKLKLKAERYDKLIESICRVIDIVKDKIV